MTEPEPEPGDRPPPAEDPQAAPDGTFRIALRCVAGTGALFTAVTLFTFGVSTALGVGLGSAIATANLAFFARVGKAFLDRGGQAAPWSVLAALKFALLLGGVWLILRAGVVSPLSLAVGYGALPIGITISTLFAPKPSDRA